jgi:hypothetical protein
MIDCIALDCGNDRYRYFSRVPLQLSQLDLSCEQWICDILETVNAQRVKSITAYNSRI